MQTIPDDRHLLDGTVAAARPFRSFRECRAAVSCFLLDGAEILRRCGVEGLRLADAKEQLADIAMTALIAFDKYQGHTEGNGEYVALREQVEREIENLNR